MDRKTLVYMLAIMITTLLLAGCAPSQAQTVAAGSETNATVSTETDASQAVAKSTTPRRTRSAGPKPTIPATPPTNMTVSAPPLLPLALAWGGRGVFALGVELQRQLPWATAWAEAWPRAPA